MPLIRRPWEFQPPGATLLDPENTLAQGIVAGTLGSSPVYIGGTASIGVSNTSFPPVATAAGIGFRAVALQQIARSITTTSDITLLIVGEVTSSSGTQSTFGGFSHNGTSDTFVIANGNGTTAGAITGRVYLGAYRTIGGSKTVPVGSTVVAVLRHRHNGAQELWVNGEKDASAGAFTGATVGNQFWGHYSATSTWAPCALGLGWNRALSDSEIASLSDNPWQVFEPERIWVPFTAATGGSFSSTGALSAQAATVAGSAAHLTLHAATGALSAQAASVSGAAVSPHLSTGALEAQAATVSGTAARLVLHGSTGALEAQAAEVSGSASKAAGGTFDGVGVLTAQAAAIAGSAARLALHTATGSLVADAAQAGGTAVHLTLHTSAGVLEAQEAVVSGVAFIGDTPPEPEPETRRRRGHASQFVQARKKLALQHLLEYLTEEEPAETTKRVIAEVKAGRPIPQVQTPRIRTDLTASELADKLIPSRVFQLQHLMPDIEPQKVIQRAIRIAQERDDEDILMLL